MGSLKKLWAFEFEYYCGGHWRVLESKRLSITDLDVYPCRSETIGFETRLGLKHDEMLQV